MTRVDGKLIARNLIEELKAEDSSSGKKTAFLLFSDSHESESFIKRKSAVAEELGVLSTVVRNKSKTTEDALEALAVTVAKGYDGVVLQLPLPEGIDADVVIDALPANVDIDMLGKEAKERYVNGATERVPPVARAVHEIFSHYLVDLFGDEIVVLGKGRLVGGPVSMYLERLQMPYKVFDETSDDAMKLEAISKADVIISGIGRPHYIKPHMIKEGVILIDAGTSESGGKIVGDADPDCESKTSLYTPVPGGVGPIVVASLFKNLFTN
jgi:methylenetetrahydrofolate dehydrogenase (NADP+) / methenyltetrahydrofolate cyclohydrolase